MNGLVVLSALAGFSLAAFAETTSAVNTAAAPASAQKPSPTASSTTTVAAPSESKFYGFLETRPTYARTTGQVDTENTVELGYQFNKNTKLTYTQFLITNLLPSGSSVGKGLNLRGDGGFVRMRVNDFYVSGDKTTRLSYQGRIYTPTDDSLSGTGMIGALYNSIGLAKDIGPVTLTLWEAPTYWAYSKNGLDTAANPIFQNRVILVADWNITKDLLFSVPLIIDAYRNRVFAPSSLSDRWEYKIFAWPELDYTINSVHSIGLAYRTKNMIAPDGAATTLGNAFNNGVFQALWNVTL